MEDKITIIEGPPPTFETGKRWMGAGLDREPAALHGQPHSGTHIQWPALLERCHRAWRHQSTIHLEYRDENGLEYEAPILAARTITVDEGQMLLMWVQLEIDLDEIDPDSDDLGDDDFDDEDFGDDLNFPDR